MLKELDSAVLTTDLPEHGLSAGDVGTFLDDPTDFDADGNVDAADLTVWNDAFGATPVADANADGQSDGADFLLWQSQVGLLPTGVYSVPEPGSAAQLSAAIVVAAMAFGLRPPNPKGMASSSPGSVAASDLPWVTKPYNF